MQWGTNGSSAEFPANGYTTQVDIYLDDPWAAAHHDVRFDWDSAINDSSGNFLRDFVFNAGTTPTTYTGTPGFVVNAATNAGRGSSFPSNTCPSPSSPPNSCRAPAYITTSGWYTFKHTFSDAGGTLAVEMTILGPGGSTVADWTIYADPTATVGGTAYGYFANQEIDGLPIDNTAYSPSGPPRDVTCTGNLFGTPGTFSGTAHDLTVPPGNACILEHATITHDVNVGANGTLGAENSTVGHDVHMTAPQEIETGRTTAAASRAARHGGRDPRAAGLSRHSLKRPSPAERSRPLA